MINVSDDKLVYISEDILSIKGIDVKLPIGRYSKPKIFNISRNFFVGTTDLNDNNIYLFNDGGELVKGFPLKGSSSYDLIDSDMDGKLEIISKIMLVLSAVTNMLECESIAFCKISGDVANIFAG